jgi:DNA-directed RNA polymerase specialized sigma24 family protein
MGEATFEETYRDLVDEVTDVVSRVMGSDIAAEDVVAETFARLHLNYRKVGATNTVDVWVLRSAIELSLEADRNTNGIGSDFGTDHRSAMTALQRMPPRPREALLLSYMTDRPDDELAMGLGLTERKFTSLTRTGLALLRHYLNADVTGATWENEEYE